MKKFRILITLFFAFSSISFTLNAQTNQNDSTSLTPKEKSFVAIAALTAKGDLVKLKMELN